MAFLLLFFVVTEPARSQYEEGTGKGIREALAPVADKILLLLSEKGQSRIAVGSFSGPAQLDLPNDLGISKILIELLNEKKPDVVKGRRAAYAVQGEYFVVPDSTNGVPSELGIRARVVKGLGTPVPGAEYTTKIPHTIEISSKAGLTVHLPAALPREALQKRLGLALERVLPDGPFTSESLDPDQIAKIPPPAMTVPKLPDTVADSGIEPATAASILRTHPDSPYGVEIVAAARSNAPTTVAEWKPLPGRPILQEDGLYFVDLRLDEVYAVRIYNEGDYDVAVYLEVDGLNSFTYSSMRQDNGSPLYSYYIIGKGPPGNRRTLTGWHRTNDSVDSFLITKYGQDASQFSLPQESTGSLGMITIKIAPSWEPGQAPPTGTRNSQSLKTTRGPPAEATQNVVTRIVGPITDVISIRYRR